VLQVQIQSSSVKGRAVEAEQVPPTGLQGLGLQGSGLQAQKRLSLVETMLQLVVGAVGQVGST